MQTCLVMYSVLMEYYLCNKRVSQGSKHWSLFVFQEIKTANGCPQSIWLFFFFVAYLPLTGRCGGKLGVLLVFMFAASSAKALITQRCITSLQKHLQKQHSISMVCLWSRAACTTRQSNAIHGKSSTAPAHCAEKVRIFELLCMFRK